MYPVEYIITYYDESDYSTDVIQGITFAENFTEAMSNIEEYYCNGIIDIKMYMLEESSVYELVSKNKDFSDSLFNKESN